MNMVLSAVHTSIGSLLDWVYPSICFACNHPLDDPTLMICHACSDGIGRITLPVCKQCGAPVGEGDPKQKSCRNCPQETLHYRAARALLFYDDERVRNLVHAFKFEYISHLSGLLNTFMLDGYRLFFSKMHFDAVVPVPLHKLRMREREFNQAELLCQSIVAETGIPLLTHALVRNRMTVPQVQLSPAQRKKNITGAFTAAEPETISGKSILLVDDVFTTGSTVNEVALTLKNAGAKSVTVYTLARAGLLSS